VPTDIAFLVVLWWLRYPLSLRHLSEMFLERVLARLFPWAPAAGDAWQALHWANGRAPLPDHERLGPDWSWQCAPLAERDGTTKKVAVP
jgi:hypothetical protein